MAAAVDGVLNSLRSRYEAPARVRQDVVQLVGQIRSLLPKTGHLISNDGSESTLLVLTGTIPITYGNATYNIPIELYLPQAYPRAAPICYVRPTSDMTVKPGHHNVDGEGLVYLPYLHEWQAGTHSLVTLCASMMSVFGREPPVYAKPPGHDQQQAQLRAQQAAIQAQAQAHQAAQAQAATPPSYTATVTPPPYGNAAGGAAAATPPPGYSTVAHDSGAAERASPPANETPKQEAVRRLTTKLRDDLKGFYANICKEVDVEYASQAKLRAGHDDVTASLERMRKHKGVLKEQIHLAKQSTADLDTWLTRRQEEEARPVDPDDLVQPRDACSQKMLELVAEAGAIEDALFALDRGLNNGTVELDLFLREVRKLSRQQFLILAHEKKIIAGG
mmetsp:Transcript_23346/g.53859  ORF Transcript_23346/g.53859 Transcript_23346/m.53859 type:complete len:390 (+) Transcript_23346:55-1224(+)